MKNKNIAYFLIDKIRNDAGCIHSQYNTEKHFRELKKHIQDEEYYRLRLAHSHYELGEGASELYDVCKVLMNKYTLKDY